MDKELAARHQEKAFALALRTLWQWDLAEDVSQEVFERALELNCIHNFYPGGQICSYSKNRVTTQK